MMINGAMQIVDVAITYPHRECHSAAASVFHGGAATEYEKVKVAKYSKLITAGQVLVPFIADTYGALSDKAIKFAKMIVPLYARQFGLTPAIASRVVFGRLTACVVRNTARIAAQG